LPLEPLQGMALFASLAFLGFNQGLAFVGTTLCADTVREHRFVALRAQGRPGQADMIMRPPHVPAGLWFLSLG